MLPRKDELDKYSHLLEEAQAIHGVSLGRDAWRRLRKSWQAMASLYVLIGIFLLAIFTPLLPLQPPRRMDRDRQFMPPSFSKTAPLVQPLRFGDPKDMPRADRVQRALDEGFGINDLDIVSASMLHIRAWVFGDWSVPSICGTDKFGRDLLSRICWGSRISCMVGLVATFVSLVIGVSYGAISGYFGGWVDNLMMRAVDVMYSVPFVFVVIFIITIVNSDEFLAMLNDNFGIEPDRLLIFFILVGAIYWLTMARVVRGQVISLKNEQFVEAARTLGAGRFRIIFLHLVPNLLSVVIVYLTLTIPRVILFEAFLSFLGLGVQKPDVSWGLLANEALQVISPVRVDWWLVLFPSLALGMTLFALNFLGDGLRDALDPRMKNR